MVTAMRWSDDVRVMFRPFATYATLAERGPTFAAGVLAPMRVTLVIACFVSWTTAGSLVLDHVLLATLSWSFLPLAQLAGAVAAARVFGDQRSVASISALYFKGAMPCMALGLGLALLCLLPAGAGPAYRWLMTSGVLAALVLAALSWCVWLSYAFFRAALSFQRLQSALATATCYLVVALIGVGYYVATHQLQPLLGFE
jgi:hypothetical protein